MSDRARGRGLEGSVSTGELEALLERALPGFHTVDRRVAVDGVPLAELAGLYGERLCLALAVDGTEQGTLPRALAALSFAASRGAALASHLAARRSTPRAIDALAPLLVLLVAQRSFQPGVIEALRPLSGENLWLFERHRLESESGASEFLASLEPAQRVAATERAAPAVVANAREPLERFVRNLPAESAALARDLALRISRIDSALECEGGEEGLAWFHAGAPLCRLEASRGRLEARLPGAGVPHLIHSLATADVFLDWVLSVHLARLEERAEPTGGDDALAEEPHRAAPILTREEIEAFRE